LTDTRRAEAVSFIFDFRQKVSRLQPQDLT
jgi:hypothetical protein